MMVHQLEATPLLLASAQSAIPLSVPMQLVLALICSLMLSRCAAFVPSKASAAFR